MRHLVPVVIFFSSDVATFRAMVMASSSNHCGCDVCDGCVSAIPHR